MQYLHTSGPPASILFSINSLICLWLLSYIAYNQTITPPLKYKHTPIGPIWFLKDFMDAVVCYGLSITNLLATNYVQACTTKYIFWLGKNKVDRTNAILVSAGRGGWQPFRGQGTVSKNQP
jgi:hypothetical protein